MDKKDLRESWTAMEIANLIRGVFRYGENEWSDMNQEIIEVASSRHPNEVALKWRQIK